jgi:hypothetical protein
MKRSGHPKVRFLTDSGIKNDPHPRRILFTEPKRAHVNIEYEEEMEPQASHQSV